MKTMISCVPAYLVDGCISTLGIYQFESNPEFKLDEELLHYIWIYSENISKNDAHEATALCFGYCYAKEDD